MYVLYKPFYSVDTVLLFTVFYCIVSVLINKIFIRSFITVLRRTQHLLSNLNALVAVSKGMQAVKLHQQNLPVLNWRCWLTQVDLYNGRKMGSCHLGLVFMDLF